MGVIIILGIVSLIAIPTIDRQLKEGKKDLSDTQIANIKKSAELWGADNVYNLPDNGDNCYLKYSTLVNSGYADEELKELSSNTLLTDNNLKITVSKDKDYSKYTYTVEFNKDGFTDIPDKYCNARYDYTNLVKNGSFEDGLNEWTTHGTGNSIELIEGNKVLKDVTSTIFNTIYVTQNLNWISGHTYYYAVKVIGNTNNNGELRFDVASSSSKIGVGTVFSISPSITSWTKKGSYFTPTISADSLISVSYGVMEGTAYIDDVMVVDLTESFGSGNEPSKEWCDKYLDYVEYGDVAYAYYK